MATQTPLRKPDNPTKPRLDFVVFGVTAVLIIGFVVWGVLDGESLNNAGGSTLAWITDNLGWLFVLSATGFVLFALFLALSKFGNIPLGKDGDKPEFRTISWIAMMFSAGMGIGLMFYGSYEPLTHFIDPPPGIEARDVQEAMATTMFHWGFHPWAMYAVVGLAIAYGTYRCGRSQLISAIFEPLLGSKATKGPAGKIIDILAIFATLFGTVASLGLGAVQIGSGLQKIGWVNQSGSFLIVAVIAVLTAAFVASAVSGIAKGIQWLSNINMVLALVLAVFVFVLGPTVFIMNLLPTTLGGYFRDITTFSARSGATVDAAGEEWLAGWTIFYWAWWVSWTPFVGMFLAKISKGRTIREFIVGVMVVPTTVSLVWFCIFGGTAIRQESQGVNLPVEREEDTLFDVLNNLPLAGIASVLVMLLVAIFFVSGADSASLVMGTLSERGTDEPSKPITIFWGVLTGAVAALLLVIGGNSQDNTALNGIKQMAIIAALPFVVVMIGICVSLITELRRDPLIVARQHLSRQVDEHVRQQAQEIATNSDEFEALVDESGNGAGGNGSRPKPNGPVSTTKPQRR
ncbi:BCCT family transporter [Gordonia sinesedis]